MIPSIALNDGHSIPQVGLGTWPLAGDEARDAVSAAIGLGYRHIDTAVRYENEDGVGAGVKASGVDRSELFITTKLDGEFQGEDRAIDGLRKSLRRLRLDYVDLLLIHWPLPARGEFVSTWHTFEKLKADGLVRSIGVSNFLPAHLGVLAAETETVPAVNQIQLSPAITRVEQRAYNAAHGIVTESWSPIKGILDESPIVEAAEKHGKTASQVALRWHVQQGLVVIPKTAHPARMVENISIFDFELDADDLAALATLDLGPGAGVNSDSDGH
ncbi:MAG: aldo/keto reductase [Rhodoglobus sp.]